jgi:hypothetical protein
LSDRFAASRNFNMISGQKRARLSFFEFEPCALGELNQSAAEEADPPVSGKRREDLLPAFFYFPLAQRDLRQEVFGGHSLGFA